MANKELRVKIQDAYDTEFNWKTNDPVLLAGQVAFSSDKYGKYKVGDGVKTWNQLEYAKTKWEDIDEKPSTFNPNQHNHTISQISDIGNASVKHATTAGSASAVAWANVSGKPSTFNPATHNHDDRYYTETEMNTKLGEKANTSALTSHTDSTGIHVTSTEKTNWNAAKAHADKAHAPSNAQANQNAFSNVSVGETTIAADTPTDTLSLVAGSNIQITPDATNDKITISATDTKYTHPNTHPASIITQDSTHKFVSDSEKNTWNGKADANHSHNYAGSTSVGGAANSAVALTSNGGSATQPVYFSGGKPIACTYTLGKSVPSNAVFTDTNTWIALKGATTTTAGTAGYAPAPTAGAANRYLRSDGTWAVPPDTNTTYGVVSTTANGLAPKRDGSTEHFLRGDGTWATPPNTTYAVASGSTNGLMSSSDKIKLDGIETGANKYVLPTAGLNALGGVKTTSQITSASGYTACPIIGGVPYYKDTNTTYTLSSFGITATAAELNFCDGVTSNIQTQLNGKAASSHSHPASQITGLPNVVAITNAQIDSLTSL